MSRLTVIIGNGRSRRGFDLELLRDHETWGCNALIRDWDPDHLVAFDPPILLELIKTFPRDSRTRVVVPPWRECLEYVDPGRLSNRLPPKNNAGVIAMKRAIQSGARHLYCLGMDSVLVAKGQNPLANVYAGTHAYGPATSATIEDLAGRIRYFAWFVSVNPKVTFTFVGPAGWGLISGELKDLPNVGFLPFRDFEELVDGQL